MAEASFTTASREETERIAGCMARELDRGDIVLVEGELGTGKTAFVRGACAALGVEDRILSPTFTIGRLYGGAVEVAHLDLYRLHGLAGADESLLDDYAAPDRLTFIEWPASAEGELPEGRIRVRVTIAHRGGDTRGIEVSGDDRLVSAVRGAGCRSAEPRRGSVP